MVHATSEDVVRKISSIDPSSFDWRAYEGTYKGRALITRLSHIPLLVFGSQAPPKPAIQLARGALLRLLPLVRETWDHRFYLRVIQWLEWTTRPELLASASKALATAVDIGKLEFNAKGADVMAQGGVAVDDMAVDEDEEAEGDDEGLKSLSGSFLREGKEEDGVPDVEWVEQAREQERKEAARLDVELRGYMSNLIKESIRLTYLAFAQLALKCGNFEGAIKHYNSAREYSTSPQHHVELGEGLVDACLKFNRPHLLAPHLSKLSSSLDRLHPPPSSAASSSAHPVAASGVRDAQAITQADLAESREANQRAMRVRRGVGAKIRVGRALLALGQAGQAGSAGPAAGAGAAQSGSRGDTSGEGEWERAGREAGEVAEEGGLGAWEGQCISSSDLALLSFLCTLASVPRDRVRRVLLDRTSFRETLADDQAWVMDVVRGFVGAQYGEVGRVLDKMEAYLLLHPFLSPYVPALLQLIHTRSVVAYVSPYASVRLDRMASAFSIEPAEMGGIVEGLVERGEIQGRLDGVDGVLHLKQTALRTELQRKVEITGTAVLGRSTGALLHMMLRQNHVIVDPRPEELRRPPQGPPTRTRGQAQAQGQGQAPSKFAQAETDHAPTSHSAGGRRAGPRNGNGTGGGAGRGESDSDEEEDEEGEEGFEDAEDGEGAMELET